MTQFIRVLGVFSVQFFFLSLSWAQGTVVSAPVSTSLDEQVGQLLMIGVPGDEFSPALKKRLEDLRPGGVILFKRNFSTKTKLSAFTEAMQKNSSTPLLIAVDQEGGSVVRIPTRIKLPSANRLGLAQDPARVEEFGKSLGTFLLRYGINMNLAPVLDVRSSLKSFVGARAFSSKAEVVTRNGVAFARGLLNSGVLPTAKHFPGLGRLATDPHKFKVTIYASEKEIRDQDLVPFQDFFKLSPSAVMLSHASYSFVDVRQPATYSNRLVEDILRTELSFKGLVITDDLLMAGAAVDNKFDSRVVRALASGSDMLLFAWSPAAQYRAKRAILNAIQTGELKASDLEIKIKRILALKKSLKEQSQVRSLASNSDPESALEKSVENLHYSSSFR